MAGDLRVLAGDAEPTLLNHWIRALMAYALHPLFLGDNDLVVNTNAMYGGAVRLDGASFVLDRSADAAHIFYFKNTSTAHNARNALQTVELPPEFAPIGPLSAAGKDSGGLRALPVQRAVPADDGKRPAVIVLPGILGSNLLSAAKQREWYEFWRVFGLIDRIQWGEDGNGITQDGPLESYYGDLIDHLRQRHHAVPFGYDWRAPLEDSARHLAALLTTLLEQRGANGAPVHLLAHSMGAIVVRVMMLNHPAVWSQWLQSETSRFVMLGAPNGGSWAPMTLYTGDDPFGRLLTNLNGWFNDQATRQKITGFEGLLQLAAGLNDEKSSWPLPALAAVAR